MQAGDWAAAEKGLTFLNSPEARGGLSATTAYVHAGARARADADWERRDEARKSYQKFFEIFKDADPDLPLLLQAKEEFAKLGS